MINKRPLRVLQVGSTMGMGGGETWLMELLRYWSKTGEVQMDLLLTSGNRGVFDDEAIALGSRLYYLPYRRSHLAQFVKGFRRILREGHYDVLHDHSAHITGWRSMMGHGLLPPIRVTHVHNPYFWIRQSYGTTFSRRVVASVGQYLIRHYTTHLAGTSRQILTEYGFDSPSFQHIPKAAYYCGFDVRRFVGDFHAAKMSLCREFGWPEDSKIVLHAGRMDTSPELGHFHNHKNTGFAVNVCLKALASDPRIRCLFVGATSVALPVLEQRVADAGATGKVIFGGVRNDIARLMLASDVLLFPSREEGLGMVAVEAQAAGLPVLASTAVPRECVVIPELVEFRDVDLGPDAWAEDLLRLAAMPRDNASANLRVAASPFSIASSAQELMRIYSGRVPGGTA